MGNVVDPSNFKAENKLIQTNLSHDQIPTLLQQRSVDFKIHIAIDFGTDGCAIAYYYNNKVTIYNKWMTKSRQRTTKVKTQILLNGNDELAAFGDNAKIIYSSLSGDEKRTWKFFDRFKMSLYEVAIPLQPKQTVHNQNKSSKVAKKINVPNFICVKAPADHQPDIENECKKVVEDVEVDSFYLKSMNGHKCKPDIVFKCAFKYLQKIALEHMDKMTNNKHIDDGEIQWILTVPAIWSEKAKHQMKQWIIEVGLIDVNIKDQCLIVYESDCAALAMFEQIKQEKQSSDNHSNNDEKISLFTNRNKYILIDAGGGTVDIACHEIVSKHSVEEVHYPTGGKYGSCYIDDEYIKLLQSIFSEQWIAEFQKLAPNVYLEIIDYFQSAKIKFYKKKNARYHNVDLPYDFVQFLHKKASRDNTSIGAKLKQYDQETVMLEDDLLIIDVAIWKRMFDKVIDRIVSDVETLLNEPKVKDCNFIALVGGFSCSKYLKCRMKTAFGANSDRKLTVKILQNPSLAVCIGAAYFGACYKNKKDFIQARILKYTYGIAVNKQLQSVLNSGISPDYMQKNMDIRSTDNAVFIKDCFRILAQQNERIDLSDKPKQFVSCCRPGVKMTGIPILCSDSINPKIKAEGEVLGTLVVPNHWQRLQVVIEFHFYGTMFTASWSTKGSKKRKQELQINYGK